MSNPVGRPLKYTPELLEELAKKLVQWVRDNRRNDRFALLSDWAFDNDFSPYYFKRYTEKNKKFKKAYLYAKAWQEHEVAKGGLNKKFDPRFSQFFLGCQHGWRSKDDAEQQKRDLRNDFVKFIDHVKNHDEEEVVDNGNIEEDEDDEDILPETD